MAHNDRNTDGRASAGRDMSEDPRLPGEPEPIVVPITDELDLHTFQPRDIPSLLDDYFEACLAAGIGSVRIIHGKGTGVLKRRVHHLLAGHRRVDCFQDAPGEAGGWGATIVLLRSGR